MKFVLASMLGCPMEDDEHDPEWDVLDEDFRFLRKKDPEAFELASSILRGGVVAMLYCNGRNCARDGKGVTFICASTIVAPGSLMRRAVMLPKAQTATFEVNGSFRGASEGNWKLAWKH